MSVDRKPVTELVPGDWIVPPSEFVQVIAVTPSFEGYTVTTANGKMFFYRDGESALVHTEFDDGQFGVGPYS